MSRILIVEDELDIAEGMSMILAEAGHQVVGIAEDEASALWKADVGTPDLVLMDIQLANRNDGVEVARRIQARHRASIIFISAHLDHRTRERAAVVEGARFLVKPCSPRGLLEALATPCDTLTGTAPNLRKRTSSSEMVMRVVSPSPVEKADTEVVEMRHRLANCYQVLANLIELRLHRTSDSTSRKHLIWVRETVQALAALQQQLARIDGRSFSTYLTEAAALWRRLGAERGIKVVERIESLPLRPDQTLPLALIANELLTNSFEHAFPQGSGTIRLQLIRFDQSNCELSVEDDGIGLGVRDRSSSLGLTLVSALAEQLGGNFALQSARGTVGQVRFPLVPPP